MWKDCHPKKDASFNIFSLANQLHWSKSTNLDSPNKSKIYFLENKVLNFIKENSEAM